MYGFLAVCAEVLLCLIYMGRRLKKFIREFYDSSIFCDNDIRETIEPLCAQLSQL